jgi:hypothetical protein
VAALLALAWGAWAGAARAEAGPLVLAVEGGDEASAERLRAAIERELGRPVVRGEAAPGVEAIVIGGRGEGGETRVTYVAPGGRRLDRSLRVQDDPARADGEIALLAGNLARDESAALLAGLGPAERAAPVAAARPVEFSCERRTGPEAPFGGDVVPYVGSSSSAAGRAAARRVSLNLLGGLSRGTGTFEGAGVWNVDTQFVCGVQGAGAGNVVAGPLRGLQGAGAFNFAGGSAAGAQGAGAFNYAGGWVRGAQVAGALNVAGGRVRGAQVAGALNVAVPGGGDGGAGGAGRGAGEGAAPPAAFEGGQVAGALNVAWGPLRGAQVAGAVNVAGGGPSASVAAGKGGGGRRVDGGVARGEAGGGVRAAKGERGGGAGAWAVEGGQVAGGLTLALGPLRGAQVAGGVSIALGRVNGAQVSGGANVAGGEVNGAQVAAVNVATGRVRGAQIGLINYSDDVDFALGFVNVVREGRTHVDAWAVPEIGLAAAALKHGGAHFHYVYGVGVRAADGAPWYALGLGGHLPLGRGWYADADALAYGRLGVDELRRDEGRGIYQLRPVVGVAVAPGVSLYAGPSANVALSLREHRRPPRPSFARSLGGSRALAVDAWPGLVLGVQLL